MRIQGKVVLITGASEGIGAACVEAFRRRGARLSLTARSEEKLRAVGGSDALVTAGDLTSEEARQRVVEATVERYGTVDVLVNSAGIGLYTPAWRAPLAEVRQVFELNFFAPFALTQLAAAHMRRQRSGTVVNISSIAGKMTLPWLTVYSSSKYALGSLTEGLRMELQADGIHAMTVCPGYVDTRFQDHALGSRPPEGIRKGKRFAVTAGECAEAIARGVERGARTVVIPRSGWILVGLQRLIPSVMERRLAAMTQPS